MEKKRYSSGRFAKLAHVSKKTLRYYNEHDILKPSYISESNIFYYSEEDLSKLQFILSLKSFGFSLNDIKEISLRFSDADFLSSSLKLQLKFINEKMTQLNGVRTNLEKAISSLNQNKNFHFSSLLSSMDAALFEEELKNQYLNSSNIESRISLHEKYSTGKIGWFDFIFNHLNLKEGMNILEVGSGDGELWKGKRIPKDCSITLSDVSSGMLSDAKENLKDAGFAYQILDLNNYKEKENSFDLVIANHVLFYIKDIPSTLNKIHSSLKKGGYFIASAYSQEHMKEITSLAQGFDDRILLSKERLYENFGKESGEALLKESFSEVRWVQFDDGLYVTDPNAIIQYVLSCHGNQNKYIVDRFSEFKEYVKDKVGDGLRITKDAGIFICRK